MRTIKFTFEYEGKKYNLKAVTDDRLTKLTNHKCNNNCELNKYNDRWYLYFYCEGNLDFEVRGFYDEDFNKVIDYIAPWDKTSENWLSDITEKEFTTNF